MRVTRILALTAVALLVQGCISFDMGPERSIPDADAKEQITVQSVDGVLPKITFVSRSSGVSRYKLELVANGTFIKHDGHTMNKGTPCLSVGLWPGLAGAENKGELAFFPSWVSILIAVSQPLSRCCSSLFATTVRNRQAASAM